jgi:hypothetical protein
MFFLPESTYNAMAFDYDRQGISHWDDMSKFIIPTSGNGPSSHI